MLRSKSPGRMLQPKAPPVISSCPLCLRPVRVRDPGAEHCPKRRIVSTEEATTPSAAAPGALAAARLGRRRGRRLRRRTPAPRSRRSRHRRRRGWSPRGRSEKEPGVGMSLHSLSSWTFGLLPWGAGEKFLVAGTKFEVV